MEKNKIKVDMFIYSHKPFKTFINNKNYHILTNSHDTEESFDTELDIFRDYNGSDNISNKNIMFNEYCGIYWIWKNFKIGDYIGLNHYNRYFDNWSEIDGENINNILKGKEIGVSSPLYLKGFTNRQWYAIFHNVNDLDHAEDLVNRKYQWMEIGYERMKNNTYIHNSSMFIMPKKVFNDYCNFIFSFMNDYNHEMGFHTPEDCLEHVRNNNTLYKKPFKYYDEIHQARITGYIAERMFNAYLLNGDNTLEENSTFIPWSQYKTEQSIEKIMSVR